jgi:gamma-glutamylcyclotransferase (GGCT)/AIG2-like uncharacterized protein YtfP
VTLALFVYGTLMTGEENHARMAGGKLLAPALTAPRYCLYDLGPYPALVAGGETAVRGELYRVSRDLLDALDAFEGHPDYFRRQAVALAGGREAAAYLFARPAELVDRAALDLGDWKRHRARRPQRRGVVQRLPR